MRAALSSRIVAGMVITVAKVLAVALCPMELQRKVIFKMYFAAAAEKSLYLWDEKRID